MTGTDMTSDFFYLPANQKATEEQRVKFTQERLALASEWITHDFVRTRPGKYSYADLSGDILFWKIIKKLGDSSYYVIWLPIYTILWLIFDASSAIYEWSNDEDKKFFQVMKEHYLNGLNDFA